MKTFDEILTDAQDAITVKRVYGEPYQQNGVTFIPAAAVRGGGGAGEGDPTENTPGGRGGGIGISARPVGAYQITGDEVSWVPAADMTKVIITGQIVAIVALLVIRSIFRTRSKG
ncbi:MAG TPA: spore germination protein GerW family protein [Acidimicrobiia bacterium]|nr:spore germination protein GerW family protein [Acidimicrobiia bacterium]